MKTTTLLKTLPVLGLTLALSACGGGDDDPVTGSITACFTANKTVNYAVKSSNVPSGSVAANRSTVGPMTYSGQAVTGQTLFYPNSQITTTNYWAVTNSGVTGIGATFNGVMTPENFFFPQNMSAGQTVTSSTNDRYTLVRFETISLAGKTFSNTCYIRHVEPQGGIQEIWSAPGYGFIKQVDSNTGETLQYNGDI